jgi:Co/Zn/Cd efflux system component
LMQIGARFMPNVLEAWKSFWTHSMELLSDVCHVESCFSPFGNSVSVGAT